MDCDCCSGNATVRRRSDSSADGDAKRNTGVDELDRLMDNRGPEEILLRNVVARGLRKAAEADAASR